MILLISWYRGLEIVLSHAVKNELHDLVEGLWEFAVWKAHPDCVRIITQHLRRVTFEQWETLNIILGPPGARDLLGDSRHKKWNEVLHDISTRLSDYGGAKDEFPSDTNDHNRDSLVSSSLLLYHTKRLSIRGAQCAWSLGYRNLEEERLFEKKREHSGTALWIASTQGSMGSSNTSHHASTYRCSKGLYSSLQVRRSLIVF
jgi:hypothetical protein